MRTIGLQFLVRQEWPTKVEPRYVKQAAGRICRLGQTHATECVRLIVSDSIEPNIVAWQQRRTADGVAASGTGQLSLGDFVHVLGR